jgi:hypothetical protein
MDNDVVVALLEAGFVFRKNGIEAPYSCISSFCLAVVGVVGVD